MSDRIGGRQGGSPDIPSRAADEPSQAAKPGPPEAAAKEAAVEKDAFERPAVHQPQSQVQSQLQTRLQNLANRPQAAKLQFSSDDLAYLAQTFAALVQQNPGANRLKRARLFAKAILKRSRIRHMFAGVPDAEMEQMCDAIADVLDGSPVFGQLVDNVTEGTGKLSG